MCWSSATPEPPLQFSSINTITTSVPCTPETTNESSSYICHVQQLHRLPLSIHSLIHSLVLPAQHALNLVPCRRRQRPRITRRTGGSVPRSKSRVTFAQELDVGWCEIRAVSCDEGFEGDEARRRRRRLVGFVGWDMAGSEHEGRVVEVDCDGLEDGDVTCRWTS